MLKKAFILGDGSPLKRSLRDKLRQGRFTIVLDGAAETVRKEKWIPDLVMGDFDRISKGTLSHFAQRTEILPTPDQEHTDLEKAIAWCILQEFDSIWIAQGWGDRADHSLANLIFLRRFHQTEREILFFTAEQKIRFLRNETRSFSGKKGRIFSILPFPQCKVSSQGLRYEMKDMPLTLGHKESVSNSSRAARVQLQIEGDALAMEEF